MHNTLKLNATKKFLLKTYGCQMNFHDSERMTGMMEHAGYQRTEAVKDADVILLNTCAVREKPENKLFAELGRLRRAKDKNPNLLIGVAGCMAPRDCDVIRQKAPWIDILLGPRSVHQLPKLIHSVEAERRPVDAIDLFDDPTPDTPIHRSHTLSAWVDVIFGCNYKCTFCVVPSSRGAEQSRPPQQIFDEIDQLQADGYKEVTLLGQTVNAYGRDYTYRFESVPPTDSQQRMDFAWLLEQIHSRAPDMRIRFTSPHPQLFTSRLISAIRDIPGVCEHVHLPLQSGDNSILRRMKRSYTVEKFLRIVDRLRTAVPDIAITTDLITGFPGETEQQFKRTLDVCEAVQFDQAFMFNYSPRKYTSAFEFTDAIPPDVQKRRLQELIDLVQSFARHKNEQDAEKVFEVLVDGPSEKNPKRLSGRTRGNKIVVFDGDDSLIGQFAALRVHKGFMWGYEGTLVQ